MKQRAKDRHSLCDDALILLDWVAKHPEEPQCYRTLARSTGLSVWAVKYLLWDARDDRYGSIISRTACKYRYDYEIYRRKRRGRYLDAVYVGY